MDTIPHPYRMVRGRRWPSLHVRPVRRMDAEACEAATLQALSYRRRAVYAVVAQPSEAAVAEWDTLHELMTGDGIDDRSEHARPAAVSVRDHEVPMTWHSVDARAEARIKRAQRPSTDLRTLGLTLADGHADERYWSLAGAAMVITADGSEAWNIPRSARGDRTAQALAGRATRKTSAPLSAAERKRKSRAVARGASEADALAAIEQARRERELAKVGRSDRGIER